MKNIASFLFFVYISKFENRKKKIQTMMKRLFILILFLFSPLLATEKMPMDLTTELVQAIHDHNFEKMAEYIVEILDQDLDVNQPDKNGIRPLYHAAQTGNFDIVRKLTFVTLDLNEQNEDFKRTALHAASFYEHFDVVQYLLDLGANVNVAGTKGDTPLHAAVFKNNLKIATLLIRNKADTNAVGIHGITPLYIALHQNYIDMAKLLITHNAQFLNDKNLLAMVESKPEFSSWILSNGLLLSGSKRKRYSVK